MPGDSPLEFEPPDAESGLLLCNVVGLKVVGGELKMSKGLARVGGGARELNLLRSLFM